MLDSLLLLVDKCMYRAARLTRLPKGDVRGTLINAAGLGLRPKHVLDIGANRGKWSRIARRTFPGCSMTLVEPQEEMRPHLDAFCRRNAGSQWVCCGVGDEMGEATFTLTPDSYASSFQIPDEVARRRGLVRRTVPLVTLDHLVENVIGSVPEVIKIDAEGNERRILEQAETIWGKTELLFVEASFVNDTPRRNAFVELVDYLAHRGYVPFDFSWFNKNKAGVTLGCEIAFVPEAGLLRQPFRKKPAAVKAAA